MTRFTRLRRMHLARWARFSPFARCAGRAAVAFAAAPRYLSLLACAMALGAVGGPAGAQPAPAAEPPRHFVIERGGTAEVPPSPRAQQTLAAFAAAYVRAGQPRIALWWNRSLSDRVADDAREVARVTAQSSRDGTWASVSASRGTEVAREAARASSLSERDLFQVETEFTRRLLDAGVQVVDRAAIVRLAAGARADAATPANLQALEMAALTGHADLFLELLLTADATAPLGVGFRTNLKAVKTGLVLGTAYLHAMPELPPAGRGTYVARPGGYELVAAPAAKVSVQAIGDALALETMQELTRRLAARPAVAAK